MLATRLVVSRRGTESPRRFGFTLVELLVVIALIGALVALLMPALQLAREAARRAECQNNLRMLTHGALQHENAHQFLPTGGWWGAWVGDPDLGVGSTQPGAWIYCLMPYVEQTAVAQLARERPGAAP